MGQRLMHCLVLAMLLYTTRKRLGQMTTGQPKPKEAISMVVGTHGFSRSRVDSYSSETSYENADREFLGLSEVTIGVQVKI